MTATAANRGRRNPPRCAVLLLAALAPLPAQELAEVFAKVSPAVVTIHTLESRLGGETEPRLEGVSKVGSGVLLDVSGTVLTAAHVVDLADEVDVEFVDGTRLRAAVVAAEPSADLALVRVRGEIPEAAGSCVLGDSSATRIGDQVFIVGAPLGMDHTLTAGHVSAKRRDERFLGGMRVEHFQTDAAINPGNSGGPLFNLRGEVVGIVCHILTSQAGSEGLGFAATSNAVRQLLLDHPRPWLGFDAFPLPEELARALNVPAGRSGLLIERVAKSSPADRAGLRAGSIPARIGGRDLLLGGDVVLEIAGQPVGTPAETEVAMAAVRDLAPGSTLRVSVLRAGKVMELAAKIGE